MKNIKERLNTISEQIADIEEQLIKDESNGYLLRAYVRNNLMEHLDSLRKEYNSIIYVQE